MGKWRFGDNLFWLTFVHYVQYLLMLFLADVRKLSFKLSIGF